MMLNHKLENDREKRPGVIKYALILLLVAVVAVGVLGVVGAAEGNESSVEVGSVEDPATDGGGEAYSAGTQITFTCPASGWFDLYRNDDFAYNWMCTPNTERTVHLLAYGASGDIMTIVGEHDKILGGVTLP
jgi:hypothetical protein